MSGSDLRQCMISARGVARELSSEVVDWRLLDEKGAAYPPREHQSRNRLFGDRGKGRASNFGW